MASTPLHFMSAYAILSAVGVPPSISVPIATYCSFPDIAAFPDHIREMMAQKAAGNKQWYKARDWQHKYKLFHETLYYWFLPHTGIDKFWHNPEGGWKPHSWVLEMIGWIIVICLI